jgi:hypothetical protein
MSLIRFKTSVGDIEVSSSVASSGQEYAAGGDLVTEATKTIKDALAPISALVQDIYKSAVTKDATPDEFEVEFGVKLTAEAGIIVSKIGSEATINFKASWKKA